MNSLAVIGDLHGNMQDWLKLRQPYETTIQLGDLGCGFVELPEPDPNHRFIRGNHDSPEIALARPDYLGDYGMFRGMFFLSGAASIDYAGRIPGVDYWPNEELSQGQMDNATQRYLRERPNIALTHCAPHCVEMMMEQAFRASKTSYMLDFLLAHHQPALWLFGHYHFAFNEVVNGTRFICVPKNTVFEL